MRIFLSLLLLVFVASSAFGQAVSRTELRNTNAVLEAKIAQRASTNAPTIHSPTLNTANLVGLGQVDNGNVQFWYSQSVDYFYLSNQFQVSMFWLDGHGLGASGFESSDGTPGASTTTGGLTFKNGLYTGGTITGGGGTASNAIPNTDGSGTNTSLYGNTRIVSTNGNGGGIDYSLGTNNVVSSATNFVADPTLGEYQVIIATNNVHFLQTTNRVAAGATNGSVRPMVFVVRAGAAQRNLSFNANWRALGSTTNNTPVAAGKEAVVSILPYDANETNVLYGVAVQQ